MTKVNNGGYLAEIQEQMEGDVFKAMIEVMSRRLMEEGVSAHLGAEPHERTASRRGHRNGYKPRSLKTRMGELALSVPQVRGMEPYSPMLFAKFERSERALLAACAEMYYLGVSTRKVKVVLETMGGFELSASTVSCVAGFWGPLRILGALKVRDRDNPEETFALRCSSRECIVAVLQMAFAGRRVFPGRSPGLRNFGPLGQMNKPAHIHRKPREQDQFHFSAPSSNDREIASCAIKIAIPDEPELIAGAIATAEAVLTFANKEESAE